MTTSDQSTTVEAPEVSARTFSRLELALFVAVLVFYAATRLVGIEDFPIFFFCDEATQANHAVDLVDNNLRDADGNLFPPYFRNARVYNLGLSVWLHAPPLALFGRSITVVRATSVAVGTVGAAALMLILKIGFGSRLWWLGGLVLACLPGWFLHSRTAFETVMMVGFYATFLLAYILYRVVSPWWLPAAMVCGAATFYSYSNGQGVMFVTGVLLLASDWRYHWQVLRTRPSVVAVGIVTALLVAAPYLRFRFILHPEMMADHLTDLHSYWIEDISLAEKIGIFLQTYGRGLSPFYWFFDDTKELVRHRMLGYGHLPLWLAPAILLGFAEAVWKSRRSAIHRLLVIAVLAAPFSASIVAIRITRVLAMMVPATLLAVIGLDRLRRWVSRWVPAPAFAGAAAAGLVVASSAMTADALMNGPTWFHDYSMNGMQWGAKQLFDEIGRPLKENPELHFVISHSWANWPDSFPAFFLEGDLRHRVRMGVIDEYLVQLRPREMSPNLLWVMTNAEYQTARSSPMLVLGEPLKVIDYPDGTPGFFITHVDYSAGAEEIFKVQQLERRRRVHSGFKLDGIPTKVEHPKFDEGGLESIFDGNLKTIARTLDADPCVLTFTFNQERPVSGVRVNVWTPRYVLKLRAMTREGEVVEASAAVDTIEDFGVYELSLPTPVAAAKEITVVIDKDGDNKVHIQEIEFLP